MIWKLTKKELRGSWPLGVLMFVPALLLAVCHFGKPDAWSYSSSTLPIPLLSNNFMFFLGWLAALGGIVLGAWLTCREKIGKTWPFLIHRPTSLGAILAAKLASSAILYFGALLPPFILLAIVSSMPGRFPAPWSINFILPGLEILTGGFALLLATMFACLPQSKLQTSYFLPLVFIGVIFLLLFLPSSWLVIFFVWLALVLLLLSAIWHAFTDRPKFGYAALALLYSGGVVTTGIFTLIMVMALGGMFGADTEYSRVVWTDQGEPRIMVNNWRTRTFCIKN